MTTPKPKPHRAETIDPGHPEYEQIDRFDRRLKELLDDEFPTMQFDRASGVMLGLIVKRIVAERKNIIDPRAAVQRAGEGMLALYDRLTRTH